jgi:hypothetical protein
MAAPARIRRPRTHWDTVERACQYFAMWVVSTPSEQSEPAVLYEKKDGIATSR